MCGSWLSFSALATVLFAVAASSSYGPTSHGFSDFSLSSPQFRDDFYDTQDEDSRRLENPVRQYVRTRRRIQGGPPNNFRAQDVFDIEGPLFDTTEPRAPPSGDRRNARPIEQINPGYAEIDGLRALPIQRPFEEERQEPLYNSGRSQASTGPTFQKLEPVFHQKVRPGVTYRLADDPHYTRSEDTRPASVVRYPGDPSTQVLHPGDVSEASPSQYQAPSSEAQYHPHFSPADSRHQPSGFSLMDNQQHPGLFQSETNSQSFEDQERAQISQPNYRDFWQKQQEELQLYRPQNEENRQKQLDQHKLQYESQHQPQQVYHQPQRPFDQPQPPLEQPQRPFEQPQQVFDQPLQSYDQPQRPFDQPQRPFDQPQRPFDQLQRPIGQPQREYEQPQHTYDQQQRSPVFYEEIDEVEQPPRSLDSITTPRNPDIALKASEERAVYKKHAPRHSAYSYKTKKPIPLQPVYSKDQPPSFLDETRPVSITKAHENEVFDHLPEYQDAFQYDSPPGESKEKRQALHGHGGGYIDHNGLEFAAAASAAEHAHGKGGDGRLTFQLHGQKGPHSYRFGFDTGKGPHRQFRYEERDNDGSVKGRYGYYDSHGKLQMYNYSAHPDHGYEAAEAH